MRAELEKSKREESILPENKHGWMQGNKSNPLHHATNVLCQRNGITHQRNSGEWVKRDVTLRRGITATSGAPSSSASRGHAMDAESRPSRKRVADVRTEDLEDNEQLVTDESAASLPQVEGESSDERMFIGNWETRRV